MQAPLKAGQYCFWHDPESQDEAREARKLGGRRRRREGVVAGSYEFDGLDSIPKIRRLVEIAAIDTLGLENSIARARVLAYLAQVAGKLLEVGELEDRVGALELVVGGRRTG